ncbi:SDR family oxidoreductase [Roseateles koreensis]|uniref:SDR family oxidoreductase n=1 Tax=Roseateles koreensis TaxID=2987526 RepID=A0ABT5KPB4_9BURK|nr:SDR family oxidoreductase [Roseateles koreensis]MDC8784755.1 SDR family oxidoreductase [Roseateles koreensis]
MTQVLVIGASRGIGFEFVRQYRAAGAQVVATARSEEGLARLRAEGANALKLDVTDTASAAGLAWQIDGYAFDVVLIVAGVYGPRSSAFQTPSAADFDAVMHANVLGPMRVLPQLGDALAPGAKIGILSSRMGSIGLRESPAGWLYRASKAAVNSVMKDASFVLQDRASCISLHPGWVQTEMGGAGADIDVTTSVSGMRQVLAGLKPADSGGFFNYDGQPLAW